MHDNNENNINNINEPIETLEPLDFYNQPVQNTLENNKTIEPVSNITEQNPLAFFNNQTNNNENLFIEQPEKTSIPFNTSIQNYNEIKKTKTKKSNPFQVIAITLVSFFLMGFMISSLFFNIHFYHISGTSMEPTIATRAWVLSSKEETYTYGDVISFDHNGVTMIKRIIALPGDIVNIDEEGNVYVNDNLLNEPYIKEKALGEPEIAFPHTVHPDTYFVLGDNRADSIDSRNIAIGGIKQTDILGKVSYSIIPYKKIS